MLGRLITCLALLWLGFACKAQPIPRNYEPWADEFGELVRLLESGNGTPAEQLRIIE